MGESHPQKKENDQSKINRLESFTILIKFYRAVYSS